MREERITDRTKHTIKTSAVAAIIALTLVMLNISGVKEIKAQPIFPGSQQITKTPASPIHQLPQQKNSATICNPNDTFVNTTESKICGVPATIKANNTATTPVSPVPSSILSSSP